MAKKLKNNASWRINSDGVCHHIPTHMALVPVKEVVATATASSKKETHHRISEWVKNNIFNIVGITTIVGCYIYGYVIHNQARAEFLNSVLDIATR